MSNPTIAAIGRVGPSSKLQSPVGGQLTLEAGVRQLFVDDFMIAEANNVKRRLHQPVKYPENPVLIPERPWEGVMTILYGTVMRDEEDGVFKMWYQAFNPTLPTAEEAAKARVTCYATSEDGIHWKRPDLGVVDYYGDSKNNSVLSHKVQEHYGEIHNVVKDIDDEDPQRLYKMTLCSGYGVAHPGSYYSACSPDGIHWTPTEVPIITYEGQKPDISHFVKNPYRNRYCLYCRVLEMRPEVARNVPVGSSGRAVALMESEDFVNWSVPETVFLVDEDDPTGSDAHRMMVIPYEGMYIGLLELYRDVVRDVEINLQLTSSRDGLNWDRVADRATFLPAGDFGEWDPHFTTFSDVPIIFKDEMWFYYGARRFKEERAVSDSKPKTLLPVTGATGLAKLRRDGFCSIGADCSGGSLTSIPLLLPEGDLHLNIKSDFGAVRLEVLLEDGRPINGGHASMSVDSTYARVQFPDAFNLTSFRSQPVRLRFHLENALLYSFWVE